MRRIARFGGGALPAAALLLLAPASPTAAATEEDQIVAVLTGMNGSYNRADFTGFAAHVCDDMRQARDFEAGWYASRRADGPTRITVHSVSVRGDGAVADVRFEAEHHDETLDVDLIRDAAGWKACRYSSGQTV